MSDYEACRDAGVHRENAEACAPDRSTAALEGWAEAVKEVNRLTEELRLKDLQLSEEKAKFKAYYDSSVEAGLAFARKVQDRDRQIELWHKYAVLLGKEIAEVVPFADMHGWKSTRFEEGKALREQIGLPEDADDWDKPLKRD